MRSVLKYGSIALALKILVVSAQAASLLPSSNDESAASAVVAGALARSLMPLR